MPVIFALRSDEVNKLFFSKEDFLKVVKNVSNPYVKTFKKGEEREANEFLSLKESNELLKFNEEQHKKKSRLQRDLHREIEMKKFRETPYVPVLHYDGKNICFLDVEAGKNKAISIGFVIVDAEKNEIVDEFYSLLKPFDFTGVDEYCEKLTGLSTLDIENARNFDEVYSEAQELLNRYQVQNIFTWGDSDIKFLRRSVPSGISYPFFASLKNIQYIISKISYGYYKNCQWSLENIMRILKIDNKPTAHNSLMDSRDLFRVYVAWKNIDMDNIDIDFILKKKETFKIKEMGA